MVRHKNRYLVIELKELEANTTKISPLVIHPAGIHGAVFGVVQQLHGDFGAAAIRAGFVAKYCNPLTKIAIIRARHGPHRLVASALPYIKHVDSVKVKVMTLYTGATIRHSYKFIKNYQQKKFDEYCFQLKTDEEKEELKKHIMKVEAVLAIK